MLHKVKGMTFLEIVVSMLIVGIALALSVSMMQTSLRFGESASYISAAQMQAQSLMDKMRVNAVAAPHYLFQASGVTEQRLLQFPMATDEQKSALYRSIDMSTLQNCIGHCKTPDLLAKQDIQAWKNALDESLPFARFQLLPSHIGHQNYLLAILWSYSPEDALSAERLKETYGVDLKIGGIIVPFSL